MGESHRTTTVATVLNNLFIRDCRYGGDKPVTTCQMTKLFYASITHIPTVAVYPRSYHGSTATRHPGHCSLSPTPPPFPPHRSIRHSLPYTHSLRPHTPHAVHSRTRSLGHKDQRRRSQHMPIPPRAVPGGRSHAGGFSGE